jgi:hypothetical protein
MSPVDRPQAVSYDPGHGELPSTLGSVLTADAETPLLLLVSPDTADEPVEIAIAVAEARAAAGHPTVLADASFNQPRLHGRLDVRNLEGLADVFLFGASLARVKARPEGHSFEFVPPGAYVPEPSAVLESSGWDHVEWELKSHSSLMILFVPASTPGLGILSARAGRAILIGDHDDATRMRPRLDPSCRVLAIVSPVREPAAAVEPAEPVDSTLTEPLVVRDEVEGPRRLSPLLQGLMAVLVVAAGWFLYRQIGATPTAEFVPEPPGAEVAAPVPRETPIPVSVAVEAHQDLSSALERTETLRRAVPGVLFYLAPVSVNGEVFYRLLAGPVSDRATGSALMQRLVEEGHKTAFDSWAIRPTEYAFHLGEYGTRGEAEARVAELIASEVPAYVVRIPYAAGGARYRVYGGAYESATEAAEMEQLIESAGFDARLVTRTGQPITGDS